MGAGPAGTTLALLLAQRGIQVSLLERQRDSAREFRGEALMPSGREALEQMGLAKLLSQVPTYTPREFAVFLNGKRVFGGPLKAEDFGGRPPLAVSQPGFLQGVIDIGQQLRCFDFQSGVAVRSLVHEDSRIAGVVVSDPLARGAEQTLTADLVVGADGRNSIVRRQMGLTTRSMSPPMDVVWCKLPCPEGWTGFHVYAGRGHLLIGYHTWDDALQLGWVISKGTFGSLRSKGVADWIETMANHVPPDLADHLRCHAEQATRPFLLDVVSDRVDSWHRPGGIVIGDAAHAMSPVGGQGINIALRDAIVAANHLVPALSERVDYSEIEGALSDVQAERLPEITQIQRMQSLPPTVVMNRAWYGELTRRAAAFAAESGSVQRVLARNVSDFLYGVTKVSLEV